jgi:hypothetical protein
MPLEAVYNNRAGFFSYLRIYQQIEVNQERWGSGLLSIKVQKMKGLLKCSQSAMNL